MGFLDPTVTLSGRLVTLRPICRDDYPILFRWRSSFETVHMLNFRRRIATFEEFVRDLEGLLPNAMFLLVREARHGVPIGYALAHGINPWDGWLAVGIYVEPEYRLRGHGGEAALLCADFLFRAFPLRKVMTEVYEFAQPLLRMVQAMGFEQFAYLADHYWHEDRWWGLYQMALTRERWNQYKERFADIIDVQRRYEAMTPVAGDGKRAE
ncbi:MAG: GNAT family protein [Dehalococcoidia bacterium]|nr:GNAT family protein [Dehalococcoidia bacterium]